MMDVEQKLIELILNRIQDPSEQKDERNVTPDTDIRKDLGFDSIMLVILQIDIEDAFQIRFDPVHDDLQKIFTTVKAMGEYVRRCLEDEK